MSGHNLQHALPVEGGVDPAYSLQSGDGELRELQAHAARLVEGGVDSDLPPLCGVVLKVAAPCNLNCSYCYVYHGADQTYRSRPPLFSEALGAPVKEAWFSDGKTVLANPATAELLIPVRGRMRRGNLRAKAIKDGGSWRLTELTLELSQPDEQVDLLSNARRPSDDSRH